MAEEQMTSQGAPVDTAPQGQPEPASTPEPQKQPKAISSEPTSAPDKKPASTASQYNEENFKSLQSSLSRQINTLHTEVQRRDQQMAYMRQQLEQAVTRDMSDTERAQYEAQQARQNEMAMRAQIQQMQYEQARQLAKLRIAELTGVNPQELDDVQTPDEGWIRGVTKQKKELEKLRKQIEGYERENSAPQTDLGTGKSKGGDPSLQEKISKAKTSFEIAQAALRARFQEN